jgi:hypothetical protein
MVSPKPASSARTSASPLQKPDGCQLKEKKEVVKAGQREEASVDVLVKPVDSTRLVGPVSSAPRHFSFTAGKTVIPIVHNVQQSKSMVNASVLEHPSP